VCVELGTELAGFEDSGEYVTAHLKKHAEDGTTSDEVVHAQYLMGSDGGRSFVRKTLGLEFIGKTRVDDYNIYGDVELAGLEEGVRRTA
jgi:2-polyprenyl-6-methoxyphenol hydroxylase-like FAD-dependent oxidoreductase